MKKGRGKKKAQKERKKEIKKQANEKLNKANSTPTCSSAVSSRNSCSCNARTVSTWSMRFSSSRICLSWCGSSVHGWRAWLFQNVFVSDSVIFSQLEQTDRPFLSSSLIWRRERMRRSWKKVCADKFPSPTFSKLSPQTSIDLESFRCTARSMELPMTWTSKLIN